MGIGLLKQKQPLHNHCERTCSRVERVFEGLKLRLRFVKVFLGLSGTFI